MEACRSIAKQYKTLRRALPSTFFLCRFGDLQAFTATVVLLLALHSNPASTRLNMQADRTEIETIVSEVIELMEEKSGDFFFSNFARHGATTILALSNLLRQDDASSSAEELTLKVPLLGTLHVRRNRATKMDEVNMQPQPSQPDSNSWNSNAYIPTPQDPHAQYTSVSALGARTVAGSQIQADFPWDPLSWSIENNHEDIFQDAMMAENFDDFAMLHSNESNFLN